jgi:hypothetical protein
MILSARFLRLLLPIFALLIGSFSLPKPQEDSFLITLEQLIELHESRNPDLIDKAIAPKQWLYVSSDKEGKDQVDMWTYTVYYHQVRAMLLNIMSSEPSLQKNQIQLHLFSKDHFDWFVAQLPAQKFEKVKEDKRENIIQTRYFNQEYLLFTTINPAAELPFLITLAKVPKK